MQAMRFLGLFWCKALFSLCCYSRMDFSLLRNNRNGHGNGPVGVLAAELRAQQPQPKQHHEDNSNQPLKDDDPLATYTEERQYPDIDEFHKYVDFAKKRQLLYQMPRPDKETLERRIQGLDDKHEKWRPNKYHHEAWDDHRIKIAKQAQERFAQRQQERDEL
jgi:hypothetical protein